MSKETNLEAYYGLPSEVKFCSKCVMSNQRPASAIEFKHTKDSKKVTLNLTKIMFVMHVEQLNLKRQLIGRKENKNWLNY